MKKGYTMTWKKKREAFIKMKQCMKKIIILMVAVAWMLTTLSGCARTNHVLDGSQIVAQVGEDSIPLGVVNFYIRMRQAQIEPAYTTWFGMTAEELWEAEVEAGVTFGQSLRMELLGELENLYILRQQAESFGVSLDAEQMAAMEAVVDQFLANNEEDALAVVSGERAYIMTILELSTISRLMSDAIRATASPNFTTEDALQKYMEFVVFPFVGTDAEGTPIELTAGEIELLRMTAQEFATTVRSIEGYDMALAAAEFGVEVHSISFDEESFFAPWEVLSAAWNLSTEGEVSGVIEAEDGFYVVKLLSLYDEEATAERLTELEEDYKQEFFFSTIEQWREETQMNRFLTVLEQIDLGGLGIIPYEPAITLEPEEDTEPIEDEE